MDTFIEVMRCVAMVVFVFVFGGMLAWLACWLERKFISPGVYKCNFNGENDEDDNNQTESGVQ